MLMFLYLALLYMSIGLIETGVALTLFFTYPIFTSLFSWLLLGIPPTSFRWMVMIVVLVGTFLTIPYSQTTS
ncbi:EamA family transporter, partial [Okeania sp. SIO2B9]